MGRRNEHSREELKALALRAAGDIVGESGAAALSMREVARRIGYTVGALYLVFTNLDDLIVHLNEQTIMELREALERIRGRTNQPDPLECFPQLHDGLLVEMHDEVVEIRRPHRASQRADHHGAAGSTREDPADSYVHGSSRVLPAAP